MHHGDMDAATMAGVIELQGRIAEQELPESCLDKTLKIATWNIREFGGRTRQPRSLHYIAEILGQFDLIGVVELRNDVRELATVLRYLGPYWDAVYSDFIEDRGGNHERVAYVYDKRACTFTGLAGNASERRKKAGKEYLSTASWWRRPFIASFRSGNFDFVAVTVHIRWGKSAAERTTELAMLADYVNDRMIKNSPIDQDLVVMGDFNIPSLKSPLYKVLTDRGLVMPRGLAGITGSNLAKNKRYDQILHNPVYTKSMAKEGGVLDFVGKGWGPLYPEAKTPFDQAYTYELSDHLPLWVMLDTDTDEEQLDQEIRAKTAKKELHDRGV